jgi:PST family polysaccharide transporter
VDVSGRGWTRAAAEGVAWGMFATVTSRLLWLAAMAVFARLLAPQEFGLYALGLVVLLYVETVGDLGVSSALIQAPEDEHESAGAAFAVSLATGALWAASTWTLAEPVAALLRTPEAAAVLRALAPAFLIKALGATHDALCQKRLRFRARFLPEAAMAATKSVLAVALALAGWGVWSLVAAQLAGLAVWTVVLWQIVPWRPRWERPNAAALRRLWRFGRWIVVVNLLAAVAHHADKLVVGRELGAAALGLYQMASKVIETSITIWIWVVGRVLFPSFARLHAAGESLAPAYLRSLRAVALVTLPGAALLAVAAEPIVATLFGGAWLAAAPILAALALFGALRSLGSSAGDVLKSTGESATLARLAAMKAGLLVPALALAAARGPVAIALSLAAATGAGLVIDVTLVGRRLELGALDWLRAVAPGALAAAATAAAAGATAAATSGWPGPARLAATGLAGVAVAGGLLLRFEPSLRLLLGERSPAPGATHEEAA